MVKILLKCNVCVCVHVPHSRRKFGGERMLGVIGFHLVSAGCPVHSSQLAHFLAKDSAVVTSPYCRSVSIINVHRCIQLFTWLLEIKLQVSVAQLKLLCLAYQEETRFFCVQCIMIVLWLQYVKKIQLHINIMLSKNFKQPFQIIVDILL